MIRMSVKAGQAQFQGRSRAAVIQPSHRLSIPCERLMDSVWLGPDRPGREGAEMINAGQA
jgi:hypothetical protein